MAGDLVAVPGVLLERLAALGVDVPRLLRHARIPAARFQVPAPRLPTREFFAFWRAAEALGARDLGLRVGSQALPHQFDVASLAALHSPDLGEALARMARYKRLVCGETVSVERAGGEARISFHWVHVEESLPMMLVDATFASILLLARRGLGQPVTPVRVELARRRENEEMLRGHFGCEVRFDAPVDLLVLDASVLARPFATHNADLLAVMLPGLEAALADGLQPRSLADEVRMVLRRRMAGERPAVEKVARELHVSPRTLQRRLGELGTTYQRLLDEVRHDTARRLLTHTDLDAGDIAFVLGFEELNSFTRAFHSWEGATPLRWRGSGGRRAAGRAAHPPPPPGPVDGARRVR